MYDDKSMNIDDFIVYIEKNIYFKDVHYFIRHIKNITTMKKIDIIRQNLWICFRKIALIWWIEKLIDNEKFMIIFTTNVDDKIDQWTRLLHFKFKFSFNIIFETFQNERYTLRNAVNRRKSKKYV